MYWHSHCTEAPSSCLVDPDIHILSRYVVDGMRTSLQAPDGFGFVCTREFTFGLWSTRAARHACIVFVKKICLVIIAIKIISKPSQNICHAILPIG